MNSKKRKMGFFDSPSQAVNANPAAKVDGAVTVSVSSEEVKAAPAVAVQETGQIQK